MDIPFHLVFPDLFPAIRSIDGTPPVFRTSLILFSIIGETAPRFM
jgi:hypothetical protein